MTIDTTAGRTLEEKCADLIGRLSKVGIAKNGQVHMGFINAADNLQAGQSAPEIVKKIAPTVFAWAVAIEDSTRNERRQKNLSVRLDKSEQWDTFLLSADVLSLMIHDKAIDEPKAWDAFVRSVKWQENAKADSDRKREAVLWREPGWRLDD